MQEEHNRDHNEKETPVKPKMKDTGTQTFCKSYRNIAVQSRPENRDIGIQVIQAKPDCADAETSCNITEILFSDQFSDQADFDSSFHLSQEEDETDSEGEDQTVGRKKSQSLGQEFETPVSAFLVYWTSLCSLLSRCFTCASQATITKKNIYGSALVVELICCKGHRNVWKSQSSVRGFYHGNIKLAASVLFSANTFKNIQNYFEMAGVPWISKSRYYFMQKNYLHGVANEAWRREHSVDILDLKNRENCHFSGDGRCDSPGHNAKYLTYSFLDQKTGKVVAMSLTQVTEAGNSNRMEKYGFKKVLKEMKDEQIKVSQLTTDRHIQIKKYLREEETEINHQFDVWHFGKNIKKMLLTTAKKKSCNELNNWIRSVINHLWWACATCENDEEMLREKWTSVIFHVQNKHSWTGNNKFKMCAHPPLKREEERCKKWLKPASDSFKALQMIVFNKSILNDMKTFDTIFAHGLFRSIPLPLQ